jgi:hypothetical protein
MDGAPGGFLESMEQIMDPVQTHKCILSADDFRHLVIGDEVIGYCPTGSFELRVELSCDLKEATRICMMAQRNVMMTEQFGPDWQKQAEDNES